MKAIVSVRTLLWCGFWLLGSALTGRLVAANVPGTALQFNGTGFATVPLSSADFEAIPMTAMCWLRTTQATTAAVLNKYQAGSLNGWQVFLMNGRVRAWYFGTSTRYVWDGANGLDGGAVNDGRWHHIAFNVDNSGGRLYVDGQLRDALPWTGEPKGAASPQPLRFGQYPGDLGGSLFTGELDQVSHWWQSLSVTNIQTLMWQTLAGTETNLIACWRFEEGNGTNAHDSAAYRGDTYAVLGTGINWVPSYAGVGSIGAVGLLATNFGDISADIIARIEPRGQPTVTWFAYAIGTNTFVAGGQTNAAADLFFMTNRIGSLPQGSQIGFWPVVQTSTGIVHGTAGYFNLPVLAGECFVLPPSSVTSTSAVLNGIFHTHGRSHFAQFDFGASTNSTVQQTFFPVLPGSESPTNVSVLRTNLSPGTTYYYRTRMVASEPSAFISFKTPPLSVEIVLSNAAFLPIGQVQLSGTVRPGGDAMARLEWGFTPSLESPAAWEPFNGLAATNISITLTGLLPGQRIYYRLVATNDVSEQIGTVREAVVPAFVRVGALPEGSQAAAAFCDIDNDGDLDLVKLLMGYHELFRNSGGTFAVEGLVWPEFFSSGMILCDDFTLDGNLDFFKMAHSAGITAGIGGSEFVQVATLPSSGPVTSAVSGDFNNDGLSDLAISYEGVGMVMLNVNAEIWRSSTEDVPAGAWLATGDFDRDGHLDLVAVGTITRVFRNDGTGHFSTNAADLPDLVDGGVAAADFDGDGWIDVALVDGATNGVTRLFRNTSSAGIISFVEVPLALAAAGGRQLTAADFNGDGRPDILSAGKLFLNLGGTNFVETPTTENPRESFYTVGDINNDGRLDLWFASGGELRVNNFPPTNSIPIAPSLLTNVVTGTQALLSWGAGHDAETGVESLTYQLHIRRGSDGGDVLPSLAGSNGYRRVLRHGQVGSARQFQFQPRFGGTFHWRVQTIDAAMAGSEFSPEQSFSIALAPEILETYSPERFFPAIVSAMVRPNAAPTMVWFEWGGTTNYVQRTAMLDISNGPPVTFSQALGTFISGSNVHFRVVASNEVGVTFGPSVAFTNPHLDAFATTGGPTNSIQALKWADVDNDGVLDAIVNGRPWRFMRGPGGLLSGGHWADMTVTVIPPLEPAYSIAAADVQRRGEINILASGRTSFNSETHLMESLVPENGSYVHGNVPYTGPFSSPPGVSFGDFDNDGRPDLLHGDFYMPDWLVFVPVARLFRQEPNGTFTLFKSGDFLACADSAAADWGDYDNDGWLDIAGFYPVPGTAHNERGTNFTTTMMGPIGPGNAGWADYDNDGWLDLQISRRLYHNDHGMLVEVPLPNFSPYYNAHWGDMDGDGWIDLVYYKFLTGDQLVYLRNRHDGTFEEAALQLPPSIGSLDIFDIGDFDGDGRVDVLTESVRGLVLQNKFAVSNAPPAAPEQFAVTLGAAGRVTFRWNAAVDDRTPSPGLSYNLRITAPDGTLLFSPESRTNGELRIPKRGRWQTTNVNLALPVMPGIYRAEVQAVDAGFSGGPFTSVQFELPASADSRKPGLLSVTASNGTTRALFHGVPGVAYSVEASDTMMPPVTWCPLGNFVADTNGFFEIVESGTSRPMRFYRMTHARE